MTEGQYESGDKREKEKLAARKGCKVTRLGENAEEWSKGPGEE